MDSRTKETLEAIETLKRYKEFLKGTRYPDSRSEHMRIEILDELDEIDYNKVIHLINLLSHAYISKPPQREPRPEPMPLPELREPEFKPRLSRPREAHPIELFECPCPFGTYPLEDLIRWKEEAIKTGNIHCAEILEKKIKEYKSHD